MAVDYRELVRGTAVAAGGDPALALAVGVEESNLDPKAVGDQGHSVGIFQENDQGAGAGLTLEQRQDPVGATQRFVARVKDLIASGFSGSPGDIAAAVQRPAYPGHYADAVNVLYAQEVQTLGGTNSGSSSSTSTSDGSSSDWEPAGWQCAILGTAGSVVSIESRADLGWLSFVTGIPQDRLQEAAYKCGHGVGATKLPGEDQVKALGDVAGVIARLPAQAGQIGTGFLVAAVIVTVGLIGLVAITKGD